LSVQAGANQKPGSGCTTGYVDIRSWPGVAYQRYGTFAWIFETAVETNKAMFRSALSEIYHVFIGVEIHVTAIMDPPVVG
jgi:hypothetical protein